jgi:hypothetical protein
MDYFSSNKKMDRNFESRFTHTFQILKKARIMGSEKNRMRGKLH